MKKYLRGIFLLFAIIALGLKVVAQPSFSYTGSPFTLPVGSSATITPAGGASVTGGYAAAVNFAAIPNVADVVYSSSAGAFFAVDYDDGDLYKITIAGVVSAINTSLSKPNSIAVDGLGNLWVADQGSNAVYRMSAAGAILNTIVGNASPTGVAVDASNNVYFTDQGNNRVYKITAGTYARTSLLTGFSAPSGIAISGNNIFVAQQGTNSIIEIVNGITGSTAKTTFATGLNSPHNLRFNTSGYLYEADANTNTVKAISTSGAVSTVLTGLNGPSGITFDASNNLYEADYSSGEVKKSPFTYWAISATLPAGLMFNYSTGVISGTPSATSPATNYTITGYNATGSLAVTISIACVAPTTLTYPTPNVFTVGTAVTLTPTYSNGLPTSCTIVSSPAGTTLASVGLSISATGVISGTPTAALTPTNFIVTSTNAGGNATSNTFTISIIAPSRPALSYSPSNYTVTYGAAVNAAITNSGGSVTSTYTVTGGTLPGGLNLNPTTGAITGIPVVTTATTVTVNASNGAGSSLTPATITFTVTPAPLTVTATGPVKTYGTALATGASTTNFTYSGTVGTQTVTSVTLTPDAFGASATTPAGSPYTVTPSAPTGANGFSASNYMITYVPYNGTVAKAGLAITANNVSKIYGNTLTGGPGSIAFTSSGLQNGETVGSVTIAYGTGAAATTAAGTYTGQVIPSAATGGSFNPNNYNITYASGNITVTGAPLTITATGPAKVYGTALTAGTSTTNFTATATANSETIASVTLTPNAAGTSATTAAGTAYIVVPSAAAGSGFNAANYIITYISYNGTVAQAPLTITPSVVNKTYGTTLSGAAGFTAFTSAGLKNGQTIGSVTVAYGTGAAANAAVGTYTNQAMISAATGGSFSAGNYIITYAPNNIIVGPATLTVTANGITKTVGTTLTGGPGSTAFTSSGLQNGETIGSVTIAYGTGSAAGAAVGTYTGQVTASAATGGSFALGNYTITYIAGTITVIDHPPIFSYIPATNNYTVGTAISPLSPTIGAGSGAIVPSAFGTGTALIVPGAGTALNSPYGMAYDASGNLYVANYAANAIDVFNSAGIYSRSFTPGGNKPTGIVFDSAGNAYVLSYSTGLVYKYNPGGTLIATLGAGNFVGNRFGFGYGITIDGSDNLYVADALDNSVTKFNTSGTVLFRITNNVNAPVNVATDASGNLYVLNNNNNRVAKFNPSGVFQSYIITGLNNPYGLSVDNSGNLYVGSSGGNAVYEYDQNGNQITAVNGIGDPRGITVDNNGNLIVSDYTANTVTTYPPIGGYYLSGDLPPGLMFNTGTGTFSGTPSAAFPAKTFTVTAYNSGGSGSTMVTISCATVPLVFNYIPATNVYPINETITPLTPTVSNGTVSPVTYNAATALTGTTFSGPSGLNLDAAGKLYVTNYDNNTISVFSANNVYQGTFGSSANLSNPDGIVFDAAGNAYVINTAQGTGNGNVAKFGPTGNFLGYIETGFNLAFGIGIDAQGFIYVADGGANKIYKYANTGGAPVLTITTTGAPADVVVDQYGNILALNRNGNSVTKFSSTGASLGTVVTGLKGAFGLKLDPAGNLYIGDSGNNLLKVYTPAGVLTTSFYSNDVEGVIIDGTGNLYAANYSGDAVYDYPPQGGYYISANLPPGLIFNNSTGSITGTPTSVFPPTTYTVTAYSYGQKSTTTVTISCIIQFDWVGTQPGGDWNTAANWAPKTVPTATDVARIGVSAAFTYPPVVATTGATTVNVKAVLLGNSGGQAAGIQVNTGYTLNVVTDVTKQSDALSASNGFVSYFKGAGTLKAVNLNVIATTAASAAYTENLSSSLSNLILSGNLTLTSSLGTNAANASFNITGGITTVTQKLLSTNVSGSTSTFSVTNGTLQFIDASPLSALASTGTNILAFNNTGGTIEYAGAAQNIYTDAAIPGVATPLSYMNIKFSGSGIKTPVSGNLNIAGNFTNALANDAGNYVNLTGTPVYFNGTTQNLAGGIGTGTIFNTVNFSGAGAKTMVSGAFSVSSTGTLNMLGTSTGTVLNAGGLLTLNSDVNGSATVPAINGPAIMGNVNVQRYITGGSSVYRGYRLLSSPVSTSSTSGIVDINYLINQVYLTGTSGTGGGFDGGSNPSLYLFRENLVPSNATFTSGNFRGVNNINSHPSYVIDIDGTGFNIPTGNGYMMFYRGDRKAAIYSAETTTSYVPTADTLTATGYLNQGRITVKDWYTPGSSNLGYTTISGSTNVMGYNLVGNPYPSSIDFDTYSTTNTAAGIYAPGVNPFIYILDPVSKNYNVYQAGNSGAGTIATSGSNIIPSGQGFFVVANTASAQLVFNETAKVSTQANAASGNLFLALKLPQRKSYMRLELLKDTINRDGIFINFNTGANSNYTINEDAPYKPGRGVVSLSSRSADGIFLAINTMSYPKQNQPIPLSVTATTSGTYTLKLTDRKNMPDMYDIWLKDAYMKDSLDIKHNSTYTFDVNTRDTASYGNNRFSLIIRQDPALSLHLINFTAQKAAGTTVQTAWTVENEANYTKFNLLKSTDGTSFNSIDSLLSTGVSTYSFTDASPKSQNYYRLQLTDLAGNISYSSVIPVSYSSSSRPVNSLTVYPNPTNNLINIAVNQGTIATSGLQNQAVASTAPATGSYDIKITNMTGEVLKSVSAVSANWQNNVSSLLPGTYIIQVFSHGSSSVVGRTTFVKL